MNLPGMPHLGTYRVIAADPPWEHDNYGQAKHGAAKSNFDEMPLASLCEMPVGSLAHPSGALLFLWCTASQEADGRHREVAAAWGFSLRTRLLTWAKTYPSCVACGCHWDDHGEVEVAADFPGVCSRCEHEGAGEDGQESDPCLIFVPKAFRGPGSYSMQGAESLWLGVRGDFAWSAARARRDIPELLFEPSRKPHSTKPARAYQRVEALWPTATPRLELFARERRENWNAWGNEAPSCDLVFGAEIGTTWPVPARAVAPPPAAPEPTLFDTTEVSQ